MPNTSILKRIFTNSQPIIGMVHLRALPGAPGYQAKQGMQAIIEAGLNDALNLARGGVDGLQIENQGDWPFLKPQAINYETVAALTAVVSAIKSRCRLPMGVNVHQNGVLQALAIAVATGCHWVRAFALANAYISPSGLIEAAGPEALRYRRMLHAEDKVMIFGDFHVKHGSHQMVADKSLEEQARDVAAALADAVIVTGTQTGSEPAREEIVAIGDRLPCPVLIGSGLCQENVEELLPLADGAIVGSFFKEDGLLSRPVDASRVRKFMKTVQELRKQGKNAP